jgi:hypothetical protein
MEDGGRGRTRTGTPVSQKQILSPPDGRLPKFLCRHAFLPEGGRNPCATGGNGLTGADTPCHRLPRLSHFGADT